MDEIFETDEDERFDEMVEFLQEAAQQEGGCYGDFWYWLTQMSNSGCLSKNFKKAVRKEVEFQFNDIKTNWEEIETEREVPARKEKMHFLRRKE